MRSNTQYRQVSPAEEMGLGPKKTALVLFTVVGCIAILFPKIFYPMIVGVPNPKDNMRGPPSKSSFILFLKFKLKFFDFRPPKAGETASFKRNDSSGNARKRQSDSTTSSDT